jgi:hypothetical protein
MRQVLAALAAFLVTVSARAESTPPMAHLAPVPGVSVDLPKTWVACDEATNKLLGGNADMHNLKAIVCVRSVAYKFRGFNPLLFHTMSMLIDQHDTQDISSQDLDALTPEIAKTVAPTVCPVITKPMTGDGTAIQSCEVTVGSFAGHKALHSIVIGVPPKSPEAKYQIDIFELPYSKGYLQVQFNSPLMFKSTTQAEMDAIIASFKVE